MATNQAPPSAIFSVIESVEAILLPLDFHDLLRAMAVCKTFRDVIAGSIGLRKTLWLHPDGPGEVLGDRHGALHGPKARQVLSLDAADPREGDLVVTALNPSFRNAFPIARTDGYRHSLQLLDRIEYECYKARKAFDGATLLWDHERGVQSFTLKISRDGGVRLADVVDSMEKFAAGEIGDYEVVNEKGYFAGSDVVALSGATGEEGTQPAASKHQLRLCKTYITLGASGYLLDFSAKVRRARFRRRFFEPPVDLGPEPIVITDNDEDMCKERRKKGDGHGKDDKVPIGRLGGLPWVERRFRFEEPVPPIHFAFR